MTHATTPTPGRRAWLQLLALVLLCLAAGMATAQTRAWLDRDRIAFGETVTLNIETDQSATPDYGPLQRGFEISARSSSRQVSLGSGGMDTRTLHAVALKPRSDGVITIPALRVGGATTSPLSLVVAPASAAVPARAGDDVFLESAPDDRDPYLQQAVGWVVRLYSAVPLVSGQLDQPQPDGATLRQVGDDAQYTREIDGRRYTVIERRYLLIPERSGTLEIPGAVFQGRGTVGFFDDFLGRSGELNARAAARFLDVQPVPANAPQPWLPLHDLKLRYQSVPKDLGVGNAATLVVEATADGASAAQMPELELPAIEGIQVFAEPVQADERFVDGRPRVTLTRRFSLVPTRGGAATMVGLSMEWWDVGAGAARTARLPPLEWDISGSAAPAASAPAATAAGGPAVPSSATGSPIDAARASVAPHRGWVLATLLFAALWLFTLVWALQRTPAATTPTAAVPPAAVPSHRTGLRSLRQALDTGDLGDVADRLRALATPPANDVDELRARLADPAQQAAVDAMEQARWGGGDGVAARALLREAFAKGPRWRQPVVAKSEVLPPLYPEE